MKSRESRAITFAKLFFIFLVYSSSIKLGEHMIYPEFEYVFSGHYSQFVPSEEKVPC